MKTYFGGSINSYKAVKVMRSPKVKIYTQTLILEFFPVIEPVNEPEEEEDDSFVVSDEPEDFSEEESSFVSPNLFEETEDEVNEEDNNELYKDFMEFVKEEISFIKEDGSIDEKKYSQFLSCPICDDCSFTSENVTKVEVQI